MNKFEYAQPEKVTEVFNYLEEPGAKIKAGGIDLLDLMKEGLEKPARLVNIRYIKELNFVNETSDGSVRIGPAITLSELASNDIINKYFPALASAAGFIATPQIRNSATLGGNLCQRPRCWYFRSEDFHCSRNGGDECFALLGENKFHAILGNDSGCAVVQASGTSIPLISLNASVNITDGKNQKTVSLEEFYVSPEKDITKETILTDNELITEIIIPSESKATNNHYIKLKEKQSFDWPIADVSVSLKMNGAKCEKAGIVLGAAAPIPWRAKDAEKVLNGKTVTPELARKAGEESMNNASPLEENGYKVRLYKTVVFRAICEAAGIDGYK